MRNIFNCKLKAIHTWVLNAKCTVRLQSRTKSSKSSNALKTAKVCEFHFKK